MRELNLALALLGSLTLALSLGAAILRQRWYFPTEQILAVLFGIAIGPYGLALFGPESLSDPMPIVEQFARVTIALAVTSIALRIPAAYFRKRARSMAALLGPGMLAMWLTSGLLAYLLLPVEFWVAMLIGAAVTPTDPVLANSIVVGTVADENIPERLRYLVSAEAGANDGGAYPVVSLAILAVSPSAGTTLAEWAIETILWEVFGAIVLGVATGAAVGYAQRWLHESGAVDETPALTISVALTAAVLGAVSLLGTDGILAVFVAGLAFNWQVDPRDEAEEQRVSEVFNRLFTIPVFVLFGAVLPWTEWAALGWAGIGLAVAVLALRRLPMMIALTPLIRPLDRPAATLFVGWFGPIGIAAVFYATFALRETGVAVVWPVVSLIVAASLFAHGSTATLFTAWYGALEDDADWW